ncbi:MAG TPA: nucleotide pyrophosphatase/phosphodiesterase family protein [Propionibacteriaceae bacterium]|nr:nucleotide pyrophosphatase/phosphodiesterase family protein [Propionibacteriaceae bacterium]
MSDGQSLPEIVVPAYQSTTLGELMPSIGAHLGVPGCPEDSYGLPQSARYVVVLIDGLGWNLLRRAVLAAPFLASLLGGAQPITSAVPSTTVTSLGSLGTGQPPGQHGLVGYTSRVPSTGEILNGLTWESDLVPTVYQSKPTFFERASQAGVAVTSVALARFQGTGLTEAALRGAAFVPFSDESAEELRIALIAEAAVRGDRSVVYAYERELDHYGHVHGCNSADWLQQLARIDAMCERLRAALPPQVTVIVTGDHGMVDIPSAQRIVAEDDPALMAGVTALAGEARFRQLYVDQEPARRVADRWRARLGELAWVRTRDEAIDEGWFAAIDDQLRERWGHVLVALRGDWAVMTSAFPREYTLIGMHGSLTPAEMLVPLLVA